MKVLKTYEKFLLKEDVEMPQVMEAPEVETPTSGYMTLYRLTSHPVVDLSAPGEFYVSKLEDVNPDLLENPGNELFLLTVECPADNVDTEKSEQECAKHNCECIVAVKDDTKCEVVKVEPYKKMIVKHLKNFNENDEFQTKPGFVERRLSQQKEYESKFTISMPVPVSAYELLTNSGVPDENIVRAYTEYVKHSLGLNTHTAGVDEFRVWCEESDNLVDFQ